MTPRVLLPTSVENKARTRLLPGAVLEAVEVLEVREAVEVKWSGGYYRRGSHRYRDGRHVITLSTRYGPADVSRTLWHELVHAVQLERYPEAEEFNAAYVRAGTRAYYETNKFEIEAREVAEEFSAALPLAR